MEKSTVDNIAALLSYQDIASHILVGSKDVVIDEVLLPSCRLKVIPQSFSSLGLRKNILLKLVKTRWVLILDSDERISGELHAEIRNIVGTRSKSSNMAAYSGFDIKYQNHFMKKPLLYGGENYSKVRLFQLSKGMVINVPIHEEIVIGGEIGRLNGKLHHYSYRSIGQVIQKFTKYAWLEAREKKKRGESVTVKKLIMYGPHMFWARCIKEEGYRDGWRGVFLASAFAYMETLTYWLLLWMNISSYEIS